MSNVIIKSASKIVLIGFSVSVNLAFLAIIFFAVTTNDMKNTELLMAVVSLYSAALSSVMTYYFARRANKKEDPIT